MKYIISAFLVVLFFSACLQPANIKIAQINAKDLEGNELDWKKYEGKTLFVHFWATWCKDCLKELPDLKGAYEELSAEDKQKIGMIFLSDEDTSRLNVFLRTNPMPFDVYQLQVESQKLGIEYIPQTHVFSSDGKTLTARIGSNKWTKQKLMGFIH